MGPAQCLNCHHTVAWDTPFCPGCGRPNPGKTEAQAVGAMVLISIAAGLYLAPAILILWPSFGSFKNAFFMALGSKSAWLGSTAFWVLIGLMIYNRRRLGAAFAGRRGEFVESLRSHNDVDSKPLSSDELGCENDVSPIINNQSVMPLMGGGLLGQRWVVSLLTGVGFASLGFIAWGFTAWMIWTVFGIRDDGTQVAIIGVGYIAIDIAIAFTAIPLSMSLPNSDVKTPSPSFLAKFLASGWLVGILAGFGFGALGLIVLAMVFRFIEILIRDWTGFFFVVGVSFDALAAVLVSIKVAKAVSPNTFDEIEG